MRTPHAGDDRASAWLRPPEIIAAEQRILTLADALLVWLREVDITPEYREKMALFFTHESKRNPGLAQDDGIADDLSVTKMWLLEKMDPDANRFLVELLRAAWDLRCWRCHHGEITTVERNRL